MNGPQLFGLVNRIIGLIVALYGLDWLTRFSLGQLGYFSLERTNINYYLVMGILYSSVGLYFMRGAAHFVRYAYPDEPELSDSEDEELTDR
jgi:hypothetical protein